MKTGAVIAAGILISFVLLMAALERRDQCRKNRNSTSDHHYPEDRDTTDPESYDALGGNAPKTPCKSQYPSEEKHRADKQKYWRWQILIGIFTLIFAAIAAVGAFRTYINSNESLFEARQQTTAARRQTDIAFAQLRPWVTVTPTISGNVEFGATSVNFPVELKLSNVGHAPAFDVHLVFDLKVYSSFAEIHQEKALLCKQDILVVSGLRDGIWMPPQGDPVRRFYESYVGAQIIAPTAAKNGNRFWAVISGCAIYRIDGDNHLHQTPFVYFFNQHSAPFSPGECGTGDAIHYEPGSTVKAEALSLCEISNPANGPY